MIPSVRAETNEFLLPEIPLWDTTVNLRAGIGYKDNLLLSSTAREQSVVFSSGLDFTVLRLPLDGKQVTFVVSAEDLRYPQGRLVNYEQFILAAAQFRMDLSSRWTGGVDLQYFYQDQVLDFSTTETITTPTKVVGHNLNARLPLRYDLSRNYWLELAPGVTRQFLQAPLDGFWEAGPKLEFGHGYGFKSSLSLAYEWKERAYDERDQVALNGTTLAGLPLRFYIHEWELALKHNWDKARHWRTTSKLGFQLNEDNGPGYFDYRRFQVSQQLRYGDKNWEIKGQARFSYYDFQNQPVSALDASLREKSVLNLSLSCERKITKRVKLVGEYHYEQSFSNRATDQYRVNKITAGIDLEL